MDKMNIKGEIRVNDSELKEYGVIPKRSLCKNCKDCEWFYYERVNRNGALVKFDLCKECLEIVKISDWLINDKGYVVSTRKINGRVFKFHTFFKEDSKLDVDHINHLKNDNRLINLREISRACNCQNRLIKTSIYPGVSACGIYKSGDKKFEARISIDDIKLYLGTFKDELEGYKAYLAKCKEIGRTINTEIPAYKIYEHTEKYLQCIRGLNENNLE